MCGAAGNVVKLLQSTRVSWNCFFLLLDVVKGDDLCFRRNVQGGTFYGCYNETHGSYSCNER